MNQKLTIMKGMLVCFLLFFATIGLSAQEKQVATGNQDSVSLDQEGRTSMLVTSSLMGVYYGGVVSTVAEFDRFELGAASYLLTIGASFFVPFMLTENVNVTKSDAILSRYGQTRGVLHGALLSDLVGYDWLTKESMAISMAGSLAEGISGYIVSEKNRYSTGRSATISAYGDFGLLMGLITDGILNADDSKTMDISLLIGSASGLLVGNLLTKTDLYTRGDAYMLSGIGALGAYVPTTLMEFFPNASTSLVSFISGAGTLGGLYIGNNLAKKYDFSTKQGFLLGMSEAAGGLMGAGVGILLSANASDDAKIKTTFICTGLGALACFALTTRNNIKNGKINKASSSKDVSFNLQVNPMVVSNMLCSIHSDNSLMNAPLLTAQVRF